MRIKEGYIMAKPRWPYQGATRSVLRCAGVPREWGRYAQAKTYVQYMWFKCQTWIIQTSECISQL